MEFSFKRVMMFGWLWTVEQHCLICANTEQRFALGAAKVGQHELSSEHSQNASHYHLRAVTARMDRRLLGRIF